MKDKKILKNLFIGLVLFFLYLPILVLVLYSFNTSKLNILFEGFTLKWYRVLLENRSLLEALGNTLIVAITSTLVSTVIGTVSAIALKKYRFFGRSALNELLYIPIVIPELVFAIALLIFFSSIHVSMSMVTLIIAHVTFSMPFVVITVRARLAGFDKSIEEAARDLGANELRTFLRVTLPMISPGVISGGMLALTMSLDDVVVSFFTAGPESQTLPLKILGMVRKGVSPDVNALSTLMILGTIVILLTATMIQGKLEKKL